MVYFRVKPRKDGQIGPDEQCGSSNCYPTGHTYLKNPGAPEALYAFCPGPMVPDDERVPCARCGKMTDNSTRCDLCAAELSLRAGGRA